MKKADEAKKNIFEKADDAKKSILEKAAKLRDTGSNRLVGEEVKMSEECDGLE